MVKKLAVDNDIDNDMLALARLFKQLIDQDQLTGCELLNRIQGRG